MALSVHQLAEWAEAARKAGAKAAELYLEEHRGWRLDQQDGMIRSRPSDHDQVAVRVWLEGGHMGLAIGHPDEQERLVQTALSAAASAPEDPFGGPAARLTIQSRGLGIDDRRYAQVDDASRRDVLTDAIKASRKVDKRIELSDFHYEDARTHRVYASTRGVLAEEFATTYRVGGRVSLAHPEGDITEDAELSGRSFADISTLPFGGHAARRCIELAGETIAPPPETRVQLEPTVVARLMACIADAWTLPAGMGSMLDERMDQQVVHPLIHLLDDGGLHGGPRTRSFDARGVPPVVVPLLQEGIVKGRLLSPEQARQREERPTGHATISGGQRVSNLTLRRGSRSLSACRSDLGGPFFLVKRIDGLDKVDLTTGRYDLLLWGTIEAGKKRPEAVIRRLRLHGDDLLCLLADVQEVSSDTDRWSHVDAPGLTLNGVDLS